jgi:hypothetical protein
VAPAPGEHTRPDGILRWDEGEDVLEGVVRKGADVIVAILIRRHSGLIIRLPLFLGGISSNRRRAGVGAAKQAMVGVSD